MIPVDGHGRGGRDGHPFGRIFAFGADSSPSGLIASVVQNSTFAAFVQRAVTEYLAATVSGAGLVILPATNHFASPQDPGLFDPALLGFLDGR